MPLQIATINIMYVRLGWRTRITYILYITDVGILQVFGIGISILYRLLVITYYIGAHIVVYLYPARR